MKKHITTLFALTRSNDSNRYFDECIDGSCLIMEMNEAYSLFEWKLMQDGATPYTSRSKFDYLRYYCDILVG